MIELDLRFDRAFRDLLEEIVADAGSSPGGAVAGCAERVTRGTDLAEFWDGDLAASLAADFDVLKGLIAHPEFGRGPIALADDAALHLLRSLSAVRLGVRENELQGIDDSDLEEGEIDPDELSYEQRRGFAAYIFFAALQESLLGQMEA